MPSARSWASNTRLRPHRVLRVRRHGRRGGRCRHRRHLRASTTRLTTASASTQMGFSILWPVGITSTGSQCARLRAGSQGRRRERLHAKAPAPAAGAPGAARCCHQGRFAVVGTAATAGCSSAKTFIEPELARSSAYRSELLRRSTRSRTGSIRPSGHPTSALSESAQTRDLIVAGFLRTSARSAMSPTRWRSTEPGDRTDALADAKPRPKTRPAKGQLGGVQVTEPEVGGAASPNAARRACAVLDRVLPGWRSTALMLRAAGRPGRGLEDGVVTVPSSSSAASRPDSAGDTPPGEQRDVGLRAGPRRRAVRARERHVARVLVRPATGHGARRAAWRCCPRPWHPRLHTAVSGRPGPPPRASTSRPES